MTTTRRRRGRPRREDSALPPLPAIDGDAPKAEDALAALDAAAQTVEGEAPAETTERAPAPLTGAVRDAAPAIDKPKIARERSTLTGRAFGAMKRSEALTALQISERQNAELRAQVATSSAAGAQKVAAVEKLCGTVLSAIFDLAALATAVDDVRLDKDEERELGELGAPAIAPYLGDYARHAPLIAFGAKLATVITTKVLTVKAEKAERAAKRRDDE